jgi:hypothetical protein
MGLVERFGNLDSSVQVLVGVGVLGALAVVLLVVTVVLAAVIGTFALGTGDALDETPPQASITASGADTDEDGVAERVSITHQGGDALAANSVVIAVDDRTSPWARYDPDVGDDLVVGDEAVIPGVESGDRIAVRHVGSDTVLLLYTVA